MLIIVGKNDVGKSSVLEALRIFFGDDLKMNTSDFPYRDCDKTISIEIHFATRHFPELHHDGVIKIKQVFRVDGDKIVSEKLIFRRQELPDKSLVEEMSYSELKGLGKKVGVEFPARKPNDQSEIDRLIMEICESLDDVPEWDWDSDRELWARIEASVFPEVVFIPAAQDHGSEQKVSTDSSAFGRLFRVGLRRWLQVDPESRGALKTVEETVNDINKKILKIVETKLLEQLPLAERLDQELDPIDISKGFSFTMYVVDEHGVRTPLSKRGSGLQRAVLIASIRAQSEIAAVIEEMESTSSDVFSETDGEREVDIPPVLYVIEEPEAFLHLKAQKDLYYSFRDLAAKGMQLIMTSHSSLFIDESDMEDVVLLHRRDGKTVSLQHIPEEDIKDELGELIRFSDLITGDVCCIVEGKSDKLAFQEWFKKLGYDHRKLGIHFICMDGCTNAEYFANVAFLDDFKIPFMMVLDTDKHKARDANQIKEYLEGKYPCIRTKQLIEVLSGELENFFDLSVVSEVLNIPLEFIDPEQYELDPKEALEQAKDMAMNAGFKNVRRYDEVKYSKKIAAKMSKEAIENQQEIYDIIERLVKMAQNGSENDMSSSPTASVFQQV